MDDKLDQLDAELLLYLFDELPAERRRALARRLETDSALAARLESLAQSRELVATSMAAADRAEPIDVRLRGIEYRTSRMLAQWKVDQTLRPAQSAATTRARHHRVPFWLYPLATAAVVLVTLGLWSLTVQKDEESGPAMAQIDDDSPASQPNVAMLNTTDDALAYWGGAEESDDPLARLERDFARHEAISFALQ